MSLSKSAPALRWWIHRAAARLGNAGVATPMYDAERIAAHVLAVTWSQMWTMSTDHVLSPDELARLDRALSRRANGEPLAYIEGSRGFYGLEIECGPGVLVPRPETEVLVDVALELIDGVERPIVVDLGTGSGAIALAIASKCPGAEVIATDISDEALAFARRNAAKLGLDVWIACGDLFEAVPQEVRGRIDLIVANPPYVPNGAGLAPDVHAEPPVAVFSGDIGNDVLERIVEAAPTWLRPGGAVALEFGAPYQVDVLEGAVVRNDLTDKPRVIWRRF
jgi:release factor glutamine methyltransferase